MITCYAKLVDKYGSYTFHLQNAIADTTKQTDHSLLQGKFEKLASSIRAIYCVQ